MLNSIQHPIKSITYEILKQVQDDKPGLFTRPSKLKMHKLISLFFFCLGVMIFPLFSLGQEINHEGWPVPDLNGLVAYSITVKKVDGVEKVVEKFFTPDGGHVARISGNGKIFAYAVDSDREPPIDYLLLDPDGYGKFSQKFRAEESYSIPEWVLN